MRSKNALRYTLALLATLSAAHAVAQDLDVRTATLDGITHGWTSTGLGAEGIVLGQPISPTWHAPTMMRQDGAGNIRLQSANDGAVPTTRVDLVSIVGDLRAAGIPAEIGSVEMDHTDRVIEFAQPFAEVPVVFTSQATFRGAQPAFTFASQVSSNDAVLSLREPWGWDGAHAVETVRYLAIEPGTYLLPGGRVLTVGRFETTVGSGYSTRSLSTEVELADDAVVVGTLQNTWSPTPAQSIERRDDQGTLRGFDVTSQNFGDATGYWVESGYLVIGARAEPATVTLLGSSPGQNQWERVPGGVSMEYLTQPNNTCYSIAEFGMDRLEQVELIGAGTARTTLALFTDARCAGAATTVEATGFERATPSHGYMDRITSAQSFRVVWRDAAERPMQADGCFAPGETLLDNGPAIVRFTEDGDLVLAKRNPATGQAAVSWRAGIEADELCVQGTGGFFGNAGLFARRGGAQVWSAYLPQGNDARLVLTEECTFEARAGWSTQLIGGERGCHAGLPLPVADPTPTPTLIFGDVDGDDDPEMVLMLTKADGSGYLMYDPLGIADFFFVVGLPPDADFLGALSQTQRATLQQQTVGAVPGGVTTIEQLLDLLERMHAEVGYTPWGQPMGGAASMPSLYRTFEFEAAVDVSAVEADAEWNGFEAGVSVGNFEFEMHNDADSFGYEISASAAEASASYDGYVTVEASVLSAEAGMYVGNDGVAVGGGADLVAVTLTAGRQDRTHIGVSAGVGVGFWAEARWGRDDLYGFTLDLPIFPVGVAVYVRGDDVRWLGNEVVRLVDTGLYEGEQLGRMVWRESSTWAVGAYGDASVVVSETFNDTKSFVDKTANGAVVGIEDATDSVTMWLEGAGWTLQNAVDSVGDTIESYGQQGLQALGGAVGDAGNWIDGAANDAGNWVDGAVNDIGNFFGGLFG